jgi:iron complex transport system substrate-binding protein
MRTLALVLLVALTPGAFGAGTPQRIISLSPDLTEILYGVGAFSRVVAVSNYDTYPPETAKLPHLGQLDSPNLEALTALKPDLIVINKAQAAFLEDKLSQLGLRVLTASNQSIQEVYAAMVLIGRATGNESGAMKLVAVTKAGLERVAQHTSGLSRPPVLLVVDRTPGTLRDLYTATDGSYLAELVNIAGARMAVGRVSNGYKKLAKEELLAINPEIILDFVQGPKSHFSGNPLEAWQEMPELKAERGHRIYSVDEDYVPHASQRMVDTAELFARLIHPGKP